MTDGFQDPITAGTALVIPAVNSPNYVLGVTGWAIRIDGTAQFTGLVLIGGTFTGTNFVINTSGAFFYSGTPATGNLIASIASTSGIDGFGNAYDAGVTAYVISSVTGSAGIWAVNLASLAIGPGGQLAALILQNLTSPQTEPQALVAFGSAAGGSAVQLNSGQSGAAAVMATFTLEDSVFSGVAGGLAVLTAALLKLTALAISGTAGAGYLALADQSSQPAALSGSAIINADANGFPVAKADSASGDTNLWHLGHFTSFSTTDEPVNSLTFASVCGGGAVVGAGKYRVHAELTVTQGPNAVADDYRLGFTGTISQVRMKAIFISTTAGGQPAFVVTTTSNNGLLPSQAVGAGVVYSATFHGVIVTTSTGTLSIQAAMSGAGDTFTVLALSDFHLERIG